MTTDEQAGRLRAQPRTVGATFCSGIGAPEVAARWGDGQTWETMDLHERADAGRLVVAAVLLLAVAVVAAVWIGWALVAHVAERVQEAGMAMGRMP